MSSRPRASMQVVEGPQALTNTLDRRGDVPLLSGVFSEPLWGRQVGSERTSAFSAAPRKAHASAGHELAPELRRRFEPRFGFDFSRVRIHADAPAARSAAALGATAFTVGSSDIFFGARAFASHTLQGDLLLGHELAHVVQSRRTPRSAPGPMSAPGDTAEREAGLAAARVAAGESVELHASPGGEVQRETKPVPVTLGELPEIGPDEAFDRIHDLVTDQFGALQLGLSHVTGGDVFRNRARLLRDRVSLLRKILADVRQARAGKTTTPAKIGFAYESLLFLVQETQLETNFLIVSSFAQAAGVPFGQINKNFEILEATLQPFVQRVLKGTPRDLADVLDAARPAFEQLTNVLNAAIPAIQKNAELSKKVVRVADLAVLALSFYQALRTQAVPDFPSKFTVSGGTAAVAKAVAGVDLVQTLAGIKELIKVGALDVSIVVGLGQLGSTSGSPLPELQKPIVSQMARFTPDERDKLVEFFGQSTKGAEDRAKNLKIPEGLTRDAIERYAELAREVIATGRDVLGVQKLRLDLCLRALGQIK